MAAVAHTLSDSTSHISPGDGAQVPGGTAGTHTGAASAGWDGWDSRESAAGPAVERPRESGRSESARRADRGDSREPALPPGHLLEPADPVGHRRVGGEQLP